MAVSGGTVIIDVQARFRDGLSAGIDSANKKIDKFSDSVNKAQKEMDRLGGTKANLNINDNATNKVEKFLSATKEFAGKTFKATFGIIDMATRPLQMIKNALFSVQGLVTTIAGGFAVKQLIANPIAMSDTIENAKIGFETLLGSAELAEKKMVEIKQFAAKTPYDTMGVVQNVQQMLNAGWDVDKVMKDMETIGNAAAATGNSTEGFTRIITAINQMRMSGKVNAQDMMQLTNANLPGWLLMAEGLGVSVQELRELTKDGSINAEQGIAALLKGLSKYDGMMDQISTRTVSGIWSNIKDTFNIKVLERWGQGLKEGVLDGFVKMADVLDAIDPQLRNMGDSLYAIGKNLSAAFSNVTGNALDRLVTVLDSSEFASADLFGKVGLIWDKVIAQPFGKWWDKTGREFMITKFGELGSGLGSLVSNGLLAILGVDTSSAANDGATIGKSFVDGFIEAIDGEAIRKAFLSAFEGLAKDALKVLPGGDSPTASSWLSALLLGGAGTKLYRGVKNLFGGETAESAKALFSGVMSADDIAYMSWLKTNANPSGGSLSKMFGSASKLGSGASKLASGASKLASGAKSFLKSNWLSLLLGAAAVYTAEDKGRELAKQVTGFAGSLGGGSLGGTLGGAIGTFIAPGAGTAIGSALGTAIGSFGGYMLGEKGMGWLWDKLDLSRFTKQAEVSMDKIQKIGEGLETSRKNAEKMATDYEKVNTALDEYSKLTKELEDPNTSKERQKELQLEINGLLKELQEIYPDIIGKHDIENGKLSTKLETLREIAKLDKERAKVELQSEINEQKKEFEKNNVADEFRSSNVKIKRGTNELEKMDSSLTTLTACNGELEKLLRQVDQYREQEDWLNLGNAQQNISDTMTEINKIMEEFDLSKYGFDENAAEKFTTEGLDTFIAKRQELIDSLSEEYEKNDQLKGVYKELYDSQLALIEMDLGGSINEMAENYDSLSQTQKQAFEQALSKVEQLQREMNQLSEKDYTVNVSIIRSEVLKQTTIKETKTLQSSMLATQALNYNKNYQQTKSKQTARDAILGKYAKHAEGGILSNPHLGLVAEDGPEAIIPLGTKRRKRGLDLWRKAGQALGVTAYANGGIVGSIQRGATASGVNVGGVTVNISVDGGNGTLVETLNSQSDEIKEAITGILYSALSESFQNQPIMI